MTHPTESEELDLEAAPVGRALLGPPNRRLEPERRLMLAVLVDALHCLQRCSETGSAQERKLHLRARRWFFDRGAAWPFSFERICEALHRNPDALRRRLARTLHCPAPAEPPVPVRGMRRRDRGRRMELLA